jgi:hypothetical protein
MANPLLRLLRLRSLLEDASRMEVERRAALAARIDSAQKRERECLRSSREQALRNICEDISAPEQARHRTAEWMSAESAAWREQQLQPLAQAAQRRVAEARENFFEHRKERQQVESVLETQRARLRVEQERRIQRELDDWFGMNQLRQRGKNQQTCSNSEKSLTPVPGETFDPGN